jgi:hypothetical protein
LDYAPPASGAIEPGQTVHLGDQGGPTYRVLAVVGDKAWVRHEETAADLLVPVAIGRRFWEEEMPGIFSCFLHSPAQEVPTLAFVFAPDLGRARELARRVLLETPEATCAEICAPDGRVLCTQAR